MPLALLLQWTARDLRKGVDRLVGWGPLVAVEELLLGRARSAFLVRWFGPALPIEGSTLLVAIANLPELRRRYLEVTEPAPAGGPNLFEPLAGLAATLAGSLASPGTSIFTGVALHQVFDHWATGLFAAFNFLSLGFLGTAVAGIAGVVALSGPAFAGSRRLQAGYGLLGALGRMAGPFLRFWKQISGPREEVTNPIFRAVLVLLDHLANLVPFAFALFAVLVSRVAPLLAPLAVQLPRLIALGREVWATILLVLADWFSRLGAFLSPEASPLAPLTIMLQALRDLVPLLSRGIGELLGPLAAALTRVGTGLVPAIEGWWTKALPYVKRSTADHPTVRTVRAFAAALSQVIKSWKGMPPKPPSSSKFLAALKGEIQRHVEDKLGPPPAFPSLAVPELSAAEAWTIPWGHFGSLFAFSKSVRGSFTDPFAHGRPATPPSIFAGEREKLALRYRKPPEAAMAELRAEEHRLREVFFALAERILPGPAAEAVGKLQPLFDQLDAELPVLDLPTSRRLRPAVEKLRIVAPGSDAADAERWGKTLRQALLQEVYPVPAGA